MEAEPTVAAMKCSRCGAEVTTEPDRLKREIRLGVAFLIAGYFSLYWLSGLPSTVYFIVASIPHGYGSSSWPLSYGGITLVQLVLVFFLIRFALIFTRRFNPRVRICEACAYEEDAGGGISVGETLLMTFWLSRRGRKLEARQ